MFPIIKSAPSVEVDSKQLAPYVRLILRTVGHSEALVTDWAQLSDFAEYGNPLSRHRLVTKIRRRFGIRVKSSDTLVSIAKKIRISRRK